MIQAVIFDLDGTVLDNEPEWETAFRAVVDSNQLSVVSWMPNNWIHEPGIGITPNWKRLVPGRVEELTVETMQEYQNRIREMPATGRKELRIREGLVELVEKIKEGGWMTALVTGSSWNVVEKELEGLDLYLAFDVTTTGEEVIAQKPDPEIYLLTCQKLGLESEECVIVEDAVAGVRAGAEAGCAVIGLESEYAPKKMLLASGAKWAVEDLNGVWGIIGGEGR